MAKQTKRGRAQDRRRVAGGQDWEVRYEAKKTKSAVKRATKRAGPQPEERRAGPQALPLIAERG